MTADRYVVTRPFPGSNVGSNLASMAGALWLASRLSRTLIVDWRGQSQLRDENANYFTEFFETPAAIEGVPIEYAPVGDFDYGQDAPDAAWLGHGDAAPVGREGRDPEARFVVLQDFHGLDRIHPGPDADRFRLLQSFYRAIHPSPPVAAAVNDFAREQLDGAFVVGLNVRTGNGMYFGRGMTHASRVDISIFENTGRFLRVLERACRRRLRGLPRQVRADARIFYATDSGAMSALLAQLPNSVTRRAIFPPPNTGDTYSFDDENYSDRDGIVDTLADMFLLARCNALVYNSSMFNQYARVLTGHFGGNETHIETLYLRKRARIFVGELRRRLT